MIWSKYLTVTASPQPRSAVRLIGEQSVTFIERACSGSDALPESRQQNI